MKSYEAILKATDKVGAKHLAAQMNVSPSLVYKWCQPNEEADASGASNPLDRVAEICAITRDTTPVTWLCQQTNGFFVENTKAGKSRQPLIKGTQKILQEFSELLNTITDDIENDGKIDEKEARGIRGEWEKLKAIAEGFVIACEAGVYNGKKLFPS